VSDPPPPSSTGAGPAPGGSLVGTRFAERYQVEELLGQGAMGTVYRAEHIHMRKAVAIKVLNPEIAGLSEISARFEREAIAAGRIEHPHVAKAMDFGRMPDGGFYLVLEFVRGRPLTELLAEGPLAPVRALRITRQIAEAMVAAHQAGVVHRDLKPDNVMLAEKEDVTDFVKVLDFGVAKLERTESDESSPITRFGAVLGTPEYMAPEQAGGGTVDHRADLYAVGVMLYEMLAGNPPFTGPDAVSVLTQQLTEPLPHLPETVPHGVAAIVMGLVDKDPDDRIASAAELITRIDQAFSEIEAAATVIMIPERTLAGTAQDGAPSQRRSLAIPIAAGAALLLLVAVAATAASFSSDTPVETLRASRSRVEVPKVVALPPPSASAVASAAPPEETAEPEASASAEPPAPAARSSARSSTKNKSTPKKTSAKPQKRKTGPFGIYIPPISKW
jgi:serine/threonine protein kinase